MFRSPSGVLGATESTWKVESMESSPEALARLEDDPG